MNPVFDISAIIDEKKEMFTSMSDRIWEHPELHFQEKYAVSLMKEALIKEGFEVETNVANLNTAIMGSFGTGPTVIAFLGEYDALPLLSQEGGKEEFCPVQEGGNGHGCGHNLLGVGSLAAAVAAKAYVEKTNAPYTIRFYGCPAEENGSGKAHMVKQGVFNDVDVAISWHPNYMNAVMNMKSLANYSSVFKFTGRSAHASSSAHIGRSALDAVELMNVGVNYLREHIIQEARVHYAVLDTGGTSPNVVQPYAEVMYLIRAPEKEQVQEIHKRIQKIAQGAALMTETTFEEVFEGTASNLIPNSTLAEVMQQQLEVTKPLQFTNEELEFAEKIFQTIDEESKSIAYAMMSNKQKVKLGHNKLSNLVYPLAPEETWYVSTDVGDVSWVTPTVQCMISSFVLGTPLHTWQVVSVGKTSIAHKGMLYAAEVMAKTGVYCMENPEVINRAKEELHERLNGKQYVTLIPETT